MSAYFASTNVDRHPWQGVVICLVGLVLVFFPGITSRIGKKWRPAWIREPSQLGHAYTRAAGVVILLLGAAVIYPELNK